MLPRCLFSLSLHFSGNIPIRAQDKVRISIYIMPISSSNPIFDHLLESSHRDNSNKWSNIGFGEEITQVESIEVHLHTLSGALPTPPLAYTYQHVYCHQDL